MKVSIALTGLAFRAVGGRIRITYLFSLKMTHSFNFYHYTYFTNLRLLVTTAKLCTGEDTG